MNTPVNFCTIASANHAPRVRTLAASLARHYPEAILHALVMDLDGDSRPAGIEDNIRWVVPGDTTIDRGLFIEMASMYSPLELSCALKPFLARDLLNAGAPVVVYLDSDTWVIARFDDFIEETHESGLVLTPHVRHALARPTALTDVESVTLSAGLINMGVFGVSTEGAPFLDWLAVRMARESIHDPDAHRNADQRWVDLALTVFPHVLASDEGVNVGWWSFAGADPGTDAEGRLLIGSTPVKVCHMSGFDPDQPWLLSTHAGEHPHGLVSQSPALWRLCAEYAAELARAGRPGDEISYRYAALPNGIELDHRVRRIFREALTLGDGGLETNPPIPLLDPDGFRTWLDAPTGVLRAPLPLSRYLRAVYEELPNASERFPDIDGLGALAFIDWCRNAAPESLALQKSLVESGAAEDPVPLCEWEMSDKVLVISEAGQQRASQDDYLGPATAEALEVAGRATVELRANSAGSPTAVSRRLAASPGFGFGAAVITASAQCVMTLRHAITTHDPRPVDPALFLIWHYDTPDERMVVDAHLAEAILVPSRFSAGGWSASAGSGPAVVGLPLAPIPSADAGSRISSGAPFHLYAPVDLDDAGFRSNPTCLLEAARLARADGTDLTITLGLRGEARWPLAAEKVRTLALDYEGIDIVDVGVSRPDRDPLIREANAVVSLHRTEAFAWACAAAMACGVPVLATAFGGNLDYMDDRNAWLVEPRRVEPVATTGVGGPAVFRAAEVDPQDAAAVLQRIVVDEAGRARRMQKGLSVRDRYSPARVGAAIARAITCRS